MDSKTSRPRTGIPLLTVLTLLSLLFIQRDLDAQRLNGGRSRIGPLSHTGGLRQIPAFPIAAGVSSARTAGNFVRLGDTTGLAFYGGQMHAAWADNSPGLADNTDLPRLDVAAARVTVNANGSITTSPNRNACRMAGNQSSTDVAVNPANPNNVVLVATNDSGAGILVSVSTDGGATWTPRTMADGGDVFAPAAGSPAVAFDTYGNCFLAYQDVPRRNVPILISTNGGAAFSPLASLAYGDVGPPALATGRGQTPGSQSVWVTFSDLSADSGAGAIVVGGAPVNGLGAVEAFRSQTAPGSSDAGFPDIDVGPTGQVIVTYQNNLLGEGLSRIYTHLDADGLGSGTLGAAREATTTNVGGAEQIPPQNAISARPGLAFDRSGGPLNGRVYLVYTDEVTDESQRTIVAVRFSDNNGATWSSPPILIPEVEVFTDLSADTGANSQFLPRVAVDQTSGNVGVVWYDCGADSGSGPFDTDGLANTDAQLRGTILGAVAVAAPAVPTGIAMTKLSDTRYDVTWNDNSSNEIGFRIARLRPGDPGFIQVAVVGPNTTSYSDPGEQQTGTFFYSVRAFNLGGFTAPTETGDANVIAIEYAGAPTDLTVTELSETIVRLTWKDNSKRETGFGIDRQLGDGGAWQQIKTTLANIVSELDAEILPGTGYNYRVRSFNVTGSSLPSAIFRALTSGKPRDLAATLVTQTAVCITWTDTSAVEEGFKIERRIGDKNYRQIGTAPSNTTAFMDARAYADTVYTYRVRAFTARGNTGASNELAVSTPPPLPAAPNGLAASVFSPTRVNLSWADNSDNETGFKIERKSGSSGVWGQIAAVGAGVTIHSDLTAAPNTQYFYRVRATNSGGDSDYTNEAEATTPPDPIAAPTNLTVVQGSGPEAVLHWTDASSNETQFRIERKPGSGAFAEVTVTAANVTDYTDTGLSPGASYTYRVRATNSVTSSDYSNQVDLTIPALPAAPSGLAVSLTSASQAHLTWVDNSANETGFRIERKQGSGSFQEISVTGAGAVEYTDTGLAAATTYTYRLRAANISGNSAYSGEASVTTPAPPLPSGGTLVVPAQVSFGRVRLHSAKTKNLVIRNTHRTQSLAVEVGAAPSPFTVLNGAGRTTIPPHSRFTVVVAFTPPAAGTSTRTLPIASGDPARPSVGVQLSGAGR